MIFIIVVNISNTFGILPVSAHNKSSGKHTSDCYSGYLHSHDYSCYGAVSCSHSSRHEHTGEYGSCYTLETSKCTGSRYWSSTESYTYTCSTCNETCSHTNYNFSCSGCGLGGSYAITSCGCGYRDWRVSDLGSCNSTVRKRVLTCTQSTICPSCNDTGYVSACLCGLSTSTYYDSSGNVSSPICSKVVAQINFKR